MNPIPLSAPDGRVYAYACGTCHHVGGGASLLVCWDEPGPIPVLVEGSLSKATSCCTCHSCGTPNPRGTDSLLWCAACRWWQRFNDVWRYIGLGYTDERCVVCGARWTSADCRSRPACSACGEDHAGVGGKCRDCNLYGANA